MTMTKKKTSKRKAAEGSRGPRKGSGGRPAKSQDRHGRTIILCDLKEWPLFFRSSMGVSYTDRVRDTIEMCEKNTRGERSKLATRWKEITATGRKGDLEDARGRSIYLGLAEWELLAKLFPVGSWADKMRQLLELAAAVSKKPKKK